MEQGFQRLRDIAKQMKDEREGGLAPKRPSPTAREFISWFGFQRRTPWFVNRVREELESCGLYTDPDFQNAYIDGPIAIYDSPETKPPIDNTLRVDTLLAAHNEPVNVTPDDDLARATTLMLSLNYSRLPVMTSKWEVGGIITWESIGVRRSLGQGGEKVRDYMDPPQVISGQRPLFEAVSTIVNHGYVLVRGENNAVSGIVTATDLNNQFLQLAEPFLLVGEIESHVRRLIHGKFTSEEIMSTTEASNDQTIGDIADLTFGNYCRLLEDPERWEKLKLQVDRKVFVDQLDRVRQIRNDVMHFNPDGLDPKEIDQLRSMAGFFQHLAHSSVPHAR